MKSRGIFDNTWGIEISAGSGKNGFHENNSLFFPFWFLFQSIYASFYSRGTPVLIFTVVVKFMVNENEVVNQMTS